MNDQMKKLLQKLSKLSRKRKLLMQEYYYSIEEAVKLQTDEALDKVFRLEKEIKRLDSEIKKLREAILGEINDRKSGH